MAQQEILIQRTTTAPPAVVFARVVDGALWPSLSPLESFSLEREGEPRRTGEGIGAVRRFTSGRIVTREQVVEREENRRFAYIMLGGMPIRDYRAEIDLEPEGNGTTLRWRSTFSPIVPGIGWIFRNGIERTIAPLVAGLTAPE